MFYFIPTPIGNLGDITLRAIETLKSVDVIACEDTRTSLKLLNKYEIKKPLYAYHKFNEITSAEGLIKLHEEGKSVAVISDAGTPCVSDPGNVLTKILKEREIPYTALPGATAFVPALILSGLDVSKFTFIGFLPEKRKEAEALIGRYKNLDATLIFYSAPHDLTRTVEVLYSVLGERNATIVKEISKIHESAESIKLNKGLNFDNAKGEYVIVVEGGKEEDDKMLSLTVEEHLNEYISRGIDKKEAVKLVAKERNIPKSEVYKYTLRKEV